MRLTIIMLVVCLLQVSAVTNAQKQKVAFNERKATLMKVFDEIERQTSFKVFYDSDIVNDQQVVNVDLNNENIQQLLEDVIDNGFYKYVIIDKDIIITKHLNNRTNSGQTQFKVTGIVTDEVGDPLPGVNVYEKTNPSNGTISGVDGRYTIEISSDEATLVFSFIGYNAQELNVAGRDKIDVTLMSESTGLNEVVVTALGIKREEKTLTYAQQTVDGDELSKAKDINFVNSIAGKASGVHIKKSSSGAGGSTKVILRGNKSLTGPSEPLYVIDGIPMANNKGGQAGMWGGVDGGDGLSQINPDDIESISVLKGSNAASLYGSQGANGVILITTKSGKKGAARVSVSSGVTFESILELPDLQFKYGAVNGAKESWSKESGNYASNYVDDFFQTGYNLINSATISGGNEKMTSYFSYANTTSRGIVPENEYQKNNVTFKQTLSMFKDYVSVTSNVMLANEKAENRNPAGYYTNPLTGLYFFPRERDFNSFKNNYQVFDEGRNMYLQN
ncbi:MAG: TonB-dependent receptor plug domain-containing protein [Carboxylicivirga sp.]|nr:TonB-dependent receptor plug domain-containing protein [Carboxylicivirga sp.]